MENEIPRNYIKQLRMDRGWSQEELAEKMNTTHATIQRHENRKRRIDYMTQRRYADIFGVHPSVIYEGENIQDDEKQVLDYYRTLSAGEKRMFSHTLKSFAEKEKQPYDDFSDRIRPKKTD